MIRHFICLANSKKLGGRCIAGVEVVFNREEKKYKLLKVNDKIRWIRPVSQTEHGEVATALVSGISLNDIVEVNIISEVPNGHQCENMRFEHNSIKKVGKITVSEQALNNLLGVDMPKLFGNRGAAVHPNDIDSINCSIILIRVEKPSVYNKKADYDDKPHPHMKFVFKGIDYDFAVTDLDFMKKFNADNNILDKHSDFYLTISLGVPYGGWYHKLVAGVILV